MPHTASRYQQDLGFTDGVILFTPALINISGTATITRNVAGDWSINQAASLTVRYGMNLADGLIYRTGFGEDLQEQFGGTGIAGSAGPQGRPPFTGSTPITPRTALKVKGIKLLSFGVIYLIGGAALTTHTTRVDKTVHANNVANAITAVLATGANGLQTAIQANPYVTEVALSAGEQVYRISDLSSYWLEVEAVSAAAGSYRMYGVRVKVEFNHN